MRKYMSLYNVLLYFSMVITGAIITALEVLPVSTQNGTMQQL